MARGGSSTSSPGSARLLLDPTAPAGAGGWGIAYSASKAAFGCVAGGLNAEFGPAVKAFNLDPGNVVTERRKALRPADVFEQGYGAESPEATAAAAAWLATSDESPIDLLGKLIFGPRLTADRHLLGVLKQEYAPPVAGALDRTATTTAARRGGGRAACYAAGEVAWSKASHSAA